MAVDVLLVAEGRIATVQLLEQVLQNLERTEGMTWRTVLDRDVTGEDIGADTVPIIVRTTNTAATLFTRTLRRHGVPYVYYVDDNFWLLDPHSPIGRHYARPSVGRMLDEVAASAARIVAATPALAEYVSAINPAVEHLDAAVNLDKYLPPLERHPDRVVMGFAGSTGRHGDLSLLAEVFLGALERHPSLHMEIIGPAVRALAHERVRHFPYLDDYEGYIAFQRERRWDIGLAPLRGTPAQDYKTDVKYREYGAQGIAGIYQVMPPYAHIRHRETGMLASTPDEWAQAIDELVTDPALRQRIAREARADIEARYGLPVVTERWRSFLESCTTVAASGADVEAVQQAVGKLDLAKAGKGTRLMHLWAYGIDQLRTQGVGHTLRRTARFVWRRVPGVKAPAEATHQEEPGGD